MTDPLLADLERTPAWRDGAVRALSRQGPALQERGSDASPALLLRVAELSVAAGAAGQALRLAEVLAADVPDPARMWFLVHRLAARGPVGRLEAHPITASDPLSRMRQATVNAEASSYLQPNTAERLAGWRAVLAEDADGFAADELRFLAATGAAQILCTRGEAAEAVDLLDQAGELARRYEAPHDEAALQLWRFLAYQQLEDRAGLLDVGRRAEQLPGDALGALPRAVGQQLRAAAAGDPVATIQALDAGIQEAYDRGDWTGYAGLAHAKFLAFDALSQPWFAYRTLKLARLVLRRNGYEALDALLAGQEQRLRARVGEEAWAAFGDRLIAQTSG